MRMNPCRSVGLWLVGFMLAAGAAHGQASFTGRTLPGLVPGAVLHCLNTVPVLLSDGTTGAVGTVALPCGTSTNPIAVVGTFTAGSVGAVGTDASVAQPAAANILATFTVSTPGAYFVQNQSAATLQVIFDDGNGTAGTVSTQLLAAGAGAGQQGADTTPPMAWFAGRIRVAGPAGSQFIARHN